MDADTEKVLVSNPDIIDVEIAFWSKMAGEHNERVCYLKCLKDKLCNLECIDPDSESD